ncbi:MAG TPA: histidine kinase [Terracidiphilus sp.]|nr:histidine kinase [Terracidiphilus sp.]
MGYREANIVLETSGFAMGTALSALLLVLVYRSGGTHRGARFLFAACILIANGAGLFKNLTLLADPGLSLLLEYRLHSIGFAAGALCPCGILLIWRANAVSSFRRTLGSWLVFYATASGILIALAVMAGAWDAAQVSSVPALRFLLNQDAVGNLTIYNGLAMLVLGGAALLPGTFEGSADRIAVALMVAGLSISAVSAVATVFVHPPGPLANLMQVARFQGLIPLVIGACFYFSHFRAADVFAKSALRLLLAGCLAMAGAVALFGPLAVPLRHAPLPHAAHILSGTAVACAVLFLYLNFGSWIDLFVERRIFGKRNPRRALQEFRQQIGACDSREPVLSFTHSLAARTLVMRPDDLRIEPDPSPRPAPATDVLIPIPSRRDPMRIAVSLRGNRRTLLTSEIDLLHEIALHAARRLDDLEREQERFERVRREGLLGRQVVEAELRALRAQINPHFLFNSLNTIASLIPSQPDKAEKITVLLSTIFRYVLLHADRPFTSLDEEIEFLRTFLEIEQIRFGERLAVEFDVDPATEHLTVPSLILQPLVENAIKHGVAPKIGRSRIFIGVQRIGSEIHVAVEDDGVGFRPRSILQRQSGVRAANGTGFGLENIRERLSTLYGAAASLALIDLERGGCRATLNIPIHGVNDDSASLAGGR